MDGGHFHQWDHHHFGHCLPLALSSQGLALKKRSKIVYRAFCFTLRYLGTTQNFYQLLAALAALGYGKLTPTYPKIAVF